MKRCTKCKQKKDLSEFNKQKKAKDGRQSHCRECHRRYFKGLLPTKRKELNKRSRQWRAKNPGKHSKSRRKCRLLREYGLTPQDWDIMYKEQKGCCFICEVHQSEIKSRLHIDHNHETGEIRKLLCGKCNTALGLLKENPTIVRSLADYLEKYNI